MWTQKEAYQYRKYLPKLEGARILPVPGIEYLKAYNQRRNSPYTMTKEVMQAFMQDARERQKSAQFDDLFRQKVGLAEDKSALVLSELQARNRLSIDNLGRLYDDLLRLENWRLSRPYPACVSQDRTWWDMNKMEMDIRQQIRRELQQEARDMAFPQKDLRESLLEFKLQNQKAQMVEGGLEMELDGSSEMYQGDTYLPQNHP